MERQILVVASADSRLKWCYSLAQKFAGTRGAKVWVNITPEANLTHTAQMMDDIGLRGPYTEYPWEQLATLDVLGTIHVIIALMGSKDNWLFLNRVREVLSASALPHRPIMVTGYAGVQLGNHVENLLWRVGFDVTCVNSRRDYEIFRAILADVGMSDEHLVRTGYVFAPPPEARRIRSGAPRTVLFATQPDIPSKRQERLYILRRLIEYAKAFPQRHVLIKPRVRPGERTIHPEPYPYPNLIEEARWEHPRNLHFVYGNMSRLLSKTDLLLTVSSTAAMESLARGIPTAILGDFGVRESVGTHFFLNSGLITTMDAILRDEIPTPNPQWMEANGFSPEDSPLNVVDRVEYLLQQQEATGQMVPFPRPYYRGESVPFHVRAVTQAQGSSANRVLVRPPARGFRGYLQVLYKRSQMLRSRWMWR